jgi:hypothetical protein
MDGERPSRRHGREEEYIQEFWHETLKERDP